MLNYLRFNLSVILIFVLSILFIAICSGNPIPIYPDPEPTTTNFSDVGSLNLAWIIVVFTMDFFIDILIIYGGIYLLNYYNLIDNQSQFNFSKSTLFLSVIIISLVGLISELVFWAWAGGLFIALMFIFISFVFVSKYILRLNQNNSIRMGLFGLIINIVAWFVIFSI